MAAWTKDELQKVAAAEELELASLRRDGTLSNAVTIWVIRVDDDVYVRSWKGDGGAWFRATQVRYHGHIETGGVGKDVAFVTEASDDIDDINDQIDAAYRAKWHRRPERRRSSSCRAQRRRSSRRRDEEPSRQERLARRPEA